MYWFVYVTWVILTGKPFSSAITRVILTGKPIVLYVYTYWFVHITLVISTGKPIVSHVFISITTYIYTYEYSVIYVCDILTYMTKICISPTHMYMYIYTSQPLLFGHNLSQIQILDHIYMRHIYIYEYYMHLFTHMCMYIYTWQPLLFGHNLSQIDREAHRIVQEKRIFA